MLLRTIRARIRSAVVFRYAGLLVAILVLATLSWFANGHLLALFVGITFVLFTTLAINVAGPSAMLRCPRCHSPLSQPVSQAMAQRQEFEACPSCGLKIDEVG